MLKLLKDSMIWHDWEQNPPKFDAEAFTWEGSLTKYIQDNFPDKTLSLRNVQQYEDNGFIYRSVDEYLDDNLIVKASLIYDNGKSSAGIKAELRSLGNRPIGNILFNDPDIERRFIEWADCDDIIYRKSIITSPRFSLELIEGFVL